MRVVTEYGGDSYHTERMWPIWFRVIVFQEFDAKDVLDTRFRTPFAPRNDLKTSAAAAKL
jgi:hypothetical protein